MRNKLPIPRFWKDNRKAGIQWWISFKQRHNLSTLPIPKAASSKRSSTRSRGKTRIYTDTPVRNEVEKKSIEKKIKQTKRKLFVKQGKRKKPQPTVISSLSEEKDIPYEEESEVDILILDEKIEPNLGNYVVVIVKGKLRSLQYTLHALMTMIMKTMIRL